MRIRLYIDAAVAGAALAVGTTAPLSAAQAHYLKSVMRRRAGEEIIVFNEASGEFGARIEGLDKKGGAVAIGARRRPPPDGAGPDLWLLFAPVKRGPMEMIAQKATELGVSALAPVITARTTTSRVNVDRLHAIATEAAEQSDRLSVPALQNPRKLDDVLSSWPEGRALIFCDEAGDDPDAPWGGARGRAPSMLDVFMGRKTPPPPSALLIGPEGGFSPEERAVIRGHRAAQAVGLGPRILRADTAAIAAIALWQAACGDWTRGA